MPKSKMHLSANIESSLPRAPWESFLLAYAATVPIVAGATACLLLRREGEEVAAHLTIIWSGAILCFLSGVRRGLSFRQKGGPTPSQLATTLWLFALSLASLVSPWVMVSLLLQIVSYTTMAVLDPIAARLDEVPRYFERLRPTQMLIPIVSLALIATSRILVLN